MTDSFTTRPAEGFTTRPAEGFTTRPAEGFTTRSTAGFTTRSTAGFTTRSAKGFTLLELIVVITIIGLLGTLVVTKVVPILFKANRTKIETDLQAVVQASKQIYATTGAFPEALEEMVNPQDENGNDLPGLEKTPTDPWGNEYGYELREGKPFAFCLGKDDQQGGEGDDEDLQYPPEDDGAGY